MKHRQPNFIVATVIELGDNQRDRWVDIGVAFHNPSSETYTVQLDAAPMNGKLVLYRPKRWEGQEKTVDVQS